MKTTLFKSGDNVVVALPADLLDRYGLGDGSEVEVREFAHGLLITPASTDDDDIDPEIERYVAEFIERYRSALESLANR